MTKQDFQDKIDMLISKNPETAEQWAVIIDLETKMLQAA